LDWQEPPEVPMLLGTPLIASLLTHNDRLKLINKTSNRVCGKWSFGQAQNYCQVLRVQLIYHFLIIKLFSVETQANSIKSWQVLMLL